jgi:hypothetical protein
VDDEVLRYRIGFRRLIEISLDLCEYARQGTYDLAYCRRNIAYLKSVLG